ncbi:hypothetical protein EYF80_027906 [Liparis tanakae]|uniref:Uncharacterized protein n=1 Tax=Liparis tanakae TaxID=230148 RepID=A0A4Z2H8N6_9TELE|nr:hypothetical protein EYF80_027906 [Liparis tanakae]
MPSPEEPEVPDPWPKVFGQNTSPGARPPIYSYGKYQFEEAMQKVSIRSDYQARFTFRPLKHRRDHADSIIDRVSSGPHSRFCLFDPACPEL